MTPVCAGLPVLTRDDLLCALVRERYGRVPWWEQYAPRPISPTVARWRWPGWDVINARRAVLLGEDIEGDYESKRRQRAAASAA